MQETLLPIQAVARKLEIPEQYFEQLRPHGGKVKLEQFTRWATENCRLHHQNAILALRRPKHLGAPIGWTLDVTSAPLSAGVGFVVVISGNVMLMPGLPKVSRASSIDVDDSGAILGV